VPYSAPGHADELDEELLERWNGVVQANYEALLPKLESRFFVLDPALANASPAPVEWFADPAEPAVCVSEAVAQELCDWDARGRHATQDEYCEFAVVRRADADGRMRPKRVQITTELAEYWTCVAAADPDRVRSMAEAVLGVDVGWDDLYGGDPGPMDEHARTIAFARLMAGHGGHDELSSQNVPADPVGRLNTENALFMTHPINGLDDLLYIVLFGAKPYAVADPERRQATRDEIFRHYEVEYLACRHADPTAAMSAYGAAWNAAQVAFADPLGMYLLQFERDVLVYGDEPIPDRWVRFSRGQEGMYQRLEVGPADDDEEFLDDIVVAAGAAERPLTGGYQLLKLISVGPHVVAAPTTPIGDDEYVMIEPSQDPIPCHEAEFCKEVAKLKEAYDAAHAPFATPRAHPDG
jgi:hypothetical protein